MLEQEAHDATKTLDDPRRGALLQRLHTHTGNARVKDAPC